MASTPSLMCLPGTYTVTAWHELYGATTQSVTVGPKARKKDGRFIS